MPKFLDSVAARYSNESCAVALLQKLLNTGRGHRALAIIALAVDVDGLGAGAGSTNIKHKQLLSP